MELDKINHDWEKCKSKLEKEFIKQMKKKQNGKGIKESKSTPNLSSNDVNNNNINIQLELLNADANFNQLIMNTRKNHIDQMINAYEELYKSVKLIRFSSIEPVSFIKNLFFLFK
jgi:hypothetical protein